MNRNMLDYTKSWYEFLDVGAALAGESSFVKFAASSTTILREATSTNVKYQVIDTQTATADLQRTPPVVTLPLWAFQLDKIMLVVQSAIGKVDWTNSDFAFASLAILNGLLLHEGQHVRLSPTEKKSLLRDVPQIPNTTRHIALSLWVNAVEDYFIEQELKHRHKVAWPFIDTLNKLIGYQINEGDDTTKTWLLNQQAQAKRNGKPQLVATIEDVKKVNEMFKGIILWRGNGFWKEVFDAFDITDILNDLDTEAMRLSKHDEPSAKAKYVGRVELFTKLFEAIAKVFWFDATLIEATNKLSTTRDDKIREESADIESAAGDEVDNVASIFESVTDLSADGMTPDEHFADKPSLRDAMRRSRDTRELSVMLKSEHEYRQLEKQETVDAQTLREVLVMRQHDNLPGPAMLYGYNVVSSRVHRIATDQKVFAPNITTNGTPKAKDLPEVVLLSDFSGSVGLGLAKNELAAMYEMMTILTELGVPCKAMVHSSTHYGGRDMPTLWFIADNQIEEHLATLETRFNRALAVDMKQNYDGFMLAKVHEKYFTAGRKGRIIFHFSDGSPVGDEYYGESARTHTQMVIERLRNEGTLTIAVSVVKGVVEYNEELYTSDYHIDASDGLGPIAHDIHKIISSFV